MTTPNPKVARRDKLTYVPKGKEPEIFGENTKNVHNLGEYLKCGEELSKPESKCW